MQLACMGPIAGPPLTHQHTIVASVAHPALHTPSNTSRILQYRSARLTAAPESTDRLQSSTPFAFALPTNEQLEPLASRKTVIEIQHENCFG